MIRDDFEDYSVDMRTILAKERTLLAEQRTQLSIVAIGLGLFATGFTFLKLLDDGTPTHRVIETIFLVGGALTVALATLHYYKVGKQLLQAEKLEKRMALYNHQRNGSKKK